MCLGTLAVVQEEAEEIVDLTRYKAEGSEDLKRIQVNIRSGVQIHLPSPTSPVNKQLHLL